MTEQRRRVLIVSFDGLRPDMVTPELMPNLTAFAREGARCAHSRATFPTETRVNQAALVTGCYPTRHGIVGNKFLEPVASPGKLFNTGDETQLAEGDRKLNGKLVEVRVLGEILADHGMSLAAISSGTPGGTRMLHHKAEQLGGFRLALHRPDASVPTERIEAVIDRIGAIPQHEIPSLSWLSYTTDTYLDYIEPELTPDVAIVWYCEPDNSYHFRGLGSEANLAALRHADAQLGRILQWREQSGIGNRLQIITMSDHGQITVTGEAVGITAGLTKAGFTVGETVSDGADAALALASAGGIYVRDSDAELTRAIVRWLQAQSWCGPLFTREAKHGTLSHAQVGIEHRRAPDIGLVLRNDDAINEHGVAGSCQHDSTFYPIGGGLHGGLHRFELNNWLAMSGDAFRADYESPLPTGVIDILPTVLTVLGLDVPDSVQGRVLHEALAGHTDALLPGVFQKTFTADGENDYRANLSVSYVGGTYYLERGWVE
ncbi:MAG: alkaline phosphatase family protein [Gammaproteobacteria bacterium]|nr:alkaline phosphatase family protein [Gammaproteobacteria bacterium]